MEAYNALVGALGRCGLLADAEALLARMHQEGLRPNTVRSFIQVNSTTHIPIELIRGFEILCTTKQTLP